MFGWLDNRVFFPYALSLEATTGVDLAAEHSQRRHLCDSLGFPHSVNKAAATAPTISTFTAGSRRRANPCYKYPFYLKCKSFPQKLGSWLPFVLHWPKSVTWVLSYKEDGKGTHKLQVFYSILKLEDLRFGEAKYLPPDHTVNILDTDLNPVLFLQSYCTFHIVASPGLISKEEI